MNRLLDTSTCVDFLRGRSPLVRDRLLAHAPADLAVSAIVVAELRHGAERSGTPDRNHAAIDAFLSEVGVVPFDADAGRSYGRIRRELEGRGRVIGANDLLIAAHAVALDVPLVASDVGHVSRVAGLALEDWREP